MKKILIMALTLGVLAGCGLLPGVGGQQVLGSFQGDWATGVDTGKLHLALVGLGGTGVTAYDNQLEIKDPNVTKSYALELPTSATEASYQLVAYSDDNSSGKLESSDAVLGTTCSKYMLYAAASGDRIYFVGSIQTLNVKSGWNSYDNKTATAPFQGESYPGFDLYRSGKCP